MAKKDRLAFLLCMLFQSFLLWPSFVSEAYKPLVDQYTRPITLLYISPNPEIKDFLVGGHNVVVLWCSLPSMRQYLQKENLHNIILLTSPVTKENLMHLAECEHFDIAIVDIDVDPDLILNRAHMADHTFYITAKNLNRLNCIGTYGEKNVFVSNRPKTILLKNWWQSVSDHKNYKILSNFDEKYLIKPALYVKSCEEKKYRWISGINLWTFYHLKGVYPSWCYIREQLLEIFNPLTHQDFGAANVLIQGHCLKAIDYDDTTYGEDPYVRLQRTLVNQLGLKYKEGE